MLNKSFTAPLWMFAVVLVLPGCQLFGSDDLEKPSINSQTIQQSRLVGGNLQPIDIKQSTVPAADVVSLRDAYAELVPLINDPQQKLQISQRLASLQMILAEQQQALGEPTDKGYYSDAIQAYQGLQQQSANGAAGQHVSYQLSRALDLQGNAVASYQTLEKLIQDYPQSQYLAEAHFRQGEYLYARGQFALAIDAYAKATEFVDSDYFAISAYMLGWSRFKLERYSSAVLAFGRVLDRYLGPQQSLDEALDIASSDGLKVGQQRLVNDSIRIMSLVFSYGNNEQGLLAYSNKIGPRHYDHRLFDGLAQLQLNNDRYKDSARVYLTFAQRYPEHRQAPDFYVKHIDAYILGKFPSLVIPAKQGYVQMFGVNGAIWPAKDAAQQASLKPYLRQYLNELSQYEHAKAQLLVRRPGSNTEQQHIVAFTLAARWYQEYIDTFADEMATLEKRFLLAESLFDAGQKLAAITQFEIYAYHLPPGEKAAEAAYAAILAYGVVLQEEPDNNRPELVGSALASQLRFIETFDDDPRANDIALRLVQTRFANKQYPEAIQVANWLLARPISAPQQLSANLVAAHSLFATEQFVAAEAGYLAVLGALSTEDKRYADMQERLGVSIYRQAELALTNHKSDKTIGLWLRIVKQLPNTKVRLNAQYDAATLLLKQKSWPQGIALLTDFAARFASHALTANIPEQLIIAYEQSAQWQAAADALYVQWQAQPEQENGRLALWTAAQYYQKADLPAKAIPALRTYAHQYARPFDTAMEARYLLSQMYLHNKQRDKRRFWLKKMIQADKTAGSKRTPRSQYLGAMSTWVLANDAGDRYGKIKLILPLRSSLNKKRQAMDGALAKFDQVLAYGVAEYSAAANFKIAEMLRILAVDLMHSQRPKGLSVLELEQYDLLLEEQAYPFEEQAIELHETNVQRSWQGNYDKWVQDSISRLSDLLPVRYGKVELVGELNDEDY